MKLARVLVAVAAVAVATPALADGPMPAGNAANGKVVFARCLVCHTIEPGKWKIGPSLFGVVGRPSHSLPGFNYSPAMQKYNVTWTPAELDKYLAAPMKVVPGTRMIFPGLPSAQDRADVIAYLATLH